MDLAQLRTDLAELLDPLGIEKTRVYPAVPDAIYGKSAVIMPERIEYDDSYDETTEVTLLVQLIAPTVATKSSQNDLDAMLSTGTTVSVHDALRNDGRFRVTELRAYGTIQIPDGGSRYYSAELLIDVLP